MATLEQTIAEANKVGTEASKVTGVAFQPLATEPITSTSLSGGGSFNIQNLPPSTSSAGMLGEIESSVDTFSKDLEAEKSRTETDYKSSFEDFARGVLETPGETELTAKAETKAGVDDLNLELKGINDQLRKEQHALRRQIEAIQDNKAGLFGGAVNQEINRVQGESLRRQADLYVIQQGVQGKYDSAKAIADRAVAVQMEQSQRKLNILQLNYERNKDLFTKAEQRAFETKQADRQFKIQEQAYRERARFDQLLSQQDPLYKLQVMKARKELDMMGQLSEKERAAELEALKQAEAAVPTLERKISLMDGILQSKAMDSVVGPTILSRAASGLKGIAGRILGSAATGAATGAAGGAVFGGVGAIPGAIGGAVVGAGLGAGLAGQGAFDVFGERQSFIAGVEQLVSKDFLDNLVNIKAQGGAFGALSKPEQDALTQAATKIGTWRITDENGKVLGYNASEADFRREIQTIQEISRAAYQKASGQLLTSDEQSYFEELEQNSLMGFNPAY
jgi:hypothetical protein